MPKLKLNFISLINQDQSIRIYRRSIVDNSQKKSDDDYRVRLPLGDEIEKEWGLFEVSLVNKEGYESFDCKFSLNPALTVHVLYRWLEERINNSDRRNKFYLPKGAFVQKWIGFVYREYGKGTSDIRVHPYFLKETGLFGFLLEHKFTLGEGQVFDRETQILSFSLDKQGRPNIYLYSDKKSELISFVKLVLKPLLDDTDLTIESKLCLVDFNRLDVKTCLVGEDGTSHSPFVGIRSSGPYRRVDGEVNYLFLFSEETRALAREIYLGLKGNLFPGQFPGLEKMFFLPINKEVVDYHLLNGFDEISLSGIREKIQEKKKSFPNGKIIMIVVLPKGFEKDAGQTFDAYNHLKLIAIEEDVYCQVATEDKFRKKDNLKWAISNIGLQIFCKLGGAPWLVKPAKNNCLIFGLGSVREESPEGEVKKYTAYTICLDSSGDFRYIKPLSSSSDEIAYLEKFENTLKEVLSSELGTHYQSFVLHLPYKISKKEIDIVKNVVSSIREDNNFEVIVIRINTNHKFLGFSDHNTCVPYESTYVQLSKNKFLIWPEGLQYEKEMLHKRVSEPLYIEFMESREDWKTKKKCLQDILNLTGANWRGFNSKARPISILYSRLIAGFMRDFSHLENISDMSIVSAESKAPWFL